MDFDISEEDLKQYSKYLKRKKIWLTKDGDEIPVIDMTDNHIMNTIKMLEKNQSNSGWKKMLKNELERRGGKQ